MSGLASDREERSELEQLQILLGRVDDLIPGGIDALGEVPRDMVPLLALFSLEEVHTPSATDGVELSSLSVLERLPCSSSGEDDEPVQVQSLQGFEERAEEARRFWTRAAMQAAARAMVLLSKGHEQLAQREFERVARLIFMSNESRRWSRVTAQEMLRAAIEIGMTKSDLIRKLEDDIPF